MRSKSSEVNSRILILTHLWLSGAYGVITGDQVALLAGCSRPLVDAARIVIESQDKSLIEAVLAGRMSLTAAAAAYRYRVRLVESFKKASPEDRVALARAIGPTKLFDSAIVPALADDPATGPVVMAKTTTTKSNGKANGNGVHMRVRPAVPPVIVQVGTH